MLRFRDPIFSGCKVIQHGAFDLFMEGLVAVVALIVSGFRLMMALPIENGDSMITF